MDKLNLTHHIAIQVTDHSLSLDQIYTNTPSPKGNPIHVILTNTDKIK